MYFITVTQDILYKYYKNLLINKFVTINISILPPVAIGIFREKKNSNSVNKSRVFEFFLFDLYYTL